MARVTEASIRDVLSPDSFVVKTREYAVLKKDIEALEVLKTKLRDSIFEDLEEDGEVDDKGNIYIELEKDINGVRRVVKQRRVVRKLEEGVADELIAGRGLEATLYKTIRVVDEDAVMAALYQGELTEEEVDSMYPPKIVWALVLAKS